MARGPGGGRSARGGMGYSRGGTLPRLTGVVAAWLLTAGCAGQAPPLGAQTAAGAAGDPSLEAIEAAVDSGRVEAARGALAAWWARDGERAGRAARTQARFLRARLTQDADSAELDYLWVAVEGGSSPYAARAWLRLAQLHLATGESARAIEALERLRADHPGGPLAGESWLWTGLAREAAGELAEACRAWERAAVAAVEARDDRTLRAARLAREACAGDAVRFTVQIGAFRDRDAAAGVLQRVREAGFDVRLEPVEEGLHRVRVGRFGSMEAARETAERLRAGGFPAVIVREED